MIVTHINMRKALSDILNAQYTMEEGAPEFTIHAMDTFDNIGFSGFPSGTISPETSGFDRMADHLMATIEDLHRREVSILVWSGRSGLTASLPSEGVTIISTNVYDLCRAIRRCTPQAGEVE